MSWRPSDPARDPDVKGTRSRRAQRGSLRRGGPHAVAATISGKCAGERSAQGDFVKLAFAQVGGRAGFQPGPRQVRRLSVFPAPDILSSDENKMAMIMDQTLKRGR